MKFLSVFEFFLVQLIIYVFIWIMNDYVASLLLLIIPIIASSILFLSFIFELIEKSKVPKIYYKYMVSMIIAPLLVGVFYFFIGGADLDWMK